MWNFIKSLYNPILFTAFIAWVLAQIIRALIYFIINHKFEWNRLYGDGGMPSSHSSVVMALAISVGLRCGWDSPVFAVAGILALIVMHDATGVRQETGKQAKVLNTLLESLNKGILTPEETLKEFVGHTGRQVIVGAFLGVLVAVLFYWWGV